MRDRLNQGRVLGEHSMLDLMRMLGVAGCYNNLLRSSEWQNCWVIVKYSVPVRPSLSQTSTDAVPVQTPIWSHKPISPISPSKWFVGLLLAPE